MTAVSPATIAMFFENRHYPDRESYLAALADVMRPEYEAIVNVGLTLQIDCPDLGCGHAMYAGKSADEVKKLVPAHVEVLVHTMLGLNADGLLVESANPRHEHEWRVWRDVALPDGRKLLPGVISHVTNVVEHPELVAERLARVARLVGPENVVASTDCGFAQGPFVRRVHPSIMWAKLGALAEGAQLASERL